MNRKAEIEGRFGSPITFDLPFWRDTPITKNEIIDDGIAKMRIDEWVRKNALRPGFNTMVDSILRDDGAKTITLNDSIDDGIAKIEAAGRRLDLLNTLRDGHTLLPTTPEKLASQINDQNKTFMDRVTDVLHRLHVAYLRWELRNLERAQKAIPAEKRALLDENERKWSRRAQEILHEAARREMEAAHSIVILKADLERMGVKS